MKAGYDFTVFCLLSVYLFGISRKDILYHEISNFAPVILILSSPFVSSIPLSERILGLLGVFLPLVAVNVLTNGFGMGDVKLCAAFGWILGAYTEYCSLAAALTAAVIAGKFNHNNRLPLAPFISLSGMAALFIKEGILKC